MIQSHPLHNPCNNILKQSPNPLHRTQLANQTSLPTVSYSTLPLFLPTEPTGHPLFEETFSAGTAIGIKPTSTHSALKEDLTTSMNHLIKYMESSTSAYRTPPPFSAHQIVNFNQPKTPSSSESRPQTFRSTHSLPTQKKSSPK